VPDEFHVSSLVVHCRRKNAAAVATALRAMDGMEVHGGVPEGKLIVTLETATEGEIVDLLNQVQALGGVLAATLVFHQCEQIHPSEASTRDCNHGTLAP